MEGHQQPPPGGDRNRGPKIVIVSSLITSLATVTIFLRFYTRTKVVRCLGWDDYTIFVAWSGCNAFQSPRPGIQE
ncbi:MAG: hypothetical protein Q9196_000869 [Gyalolechia fulgens]